MAVFRQPPSGMAGPMPVSRWHTLLWGVVGIILGLFLLTQPALSAVALLTTVAVFWFIGGVVDVVSALWERTGNWGWRIVAGIISVIAALVVFAHPLASTLITFGALYFLLGVAAIVTGLSSLVLSESVGSVVLGIILIAIGIMLLAQPLGLVSFTAMVQWMGIVAIVGGILTIVGVFVGPRPAPER